MLKEQIAPFLEGLLYPSESDEPVTYVHRPWPAENLSVEAFKALFEIAPTDFVEEHDGLAFWRPVSDLYPWYTEEEVARTQAFNALKTLLNTSLAQIHYFYVGQKVVDIYVVGLAEDGQLEGITTRAVYT